MKRFIIIITILLSGSFVFSKEPDLFHGTFYQKTTKDSITAKKNALSLAPLPKPIPLSFIKKQENKKLIAVILAVALGPFGVHRLYLGTTPKVPVAYTLTLGGGLGILPLADIIAIITAKNMDRYLDNPKVLMWVK